MGVIDYKYDEELKATLEIFDLTFAEFIEWCRDKNLFEACAYRANVKWWIDWKED